MKWLKNNVIPIILSSLILLVISLLSYQASELRAEVKSKADVSYVDYRDSLARMSIIQTQSDFKEYKSNHQEIHDKTNTEIERMFQQILQNQKVLMERRD